MPNTNDIHTWPDLAIGLYDRLTGRDAEISYNFDDFELHIPSSTAANAGQARWKMNGALRITTRNGKACDLQCPGTAACLACYVL